jgi:hypothetical protein
VIDDRAGDPNQGYQVGDNADGGKGEIICLEVRSEKWDVRRLIFEMRKNFFSEEIGDTGA